MLCRGRGEEPTPRRAPGDTDDRGNVRLVDRALPAPARRFVPRISASATETSPPWHCCRAGPERVELMAGMLDSAERVSDRRGYTVFTGSHDGALLTVATSGVGSPSLAIAVEELAACGTSCFIRVGSCAALSPRLPVGGDRSGNRRGERRGHQPQLCAGDTSPPVASHRVTAALVAAAGPPRHARGGRPDPLDRQLLRGGAHRRGDPALEGSGRAPPSRWSRRACSPWPRRLGCEAGSVLCAGTNLLTGEATYQVRPVRGIRRGPAGDVGIRPGCSRRTLARR